MEKSNTDSPNSFFLFSGLFLCLLQLFITFPIAVWKRNKFNFEAPLTHSMSIFGLMIIAIILISGAFALVTPRKWRNVFISLFAVLASLIFIQQNFLNWNYGILDGQSLDFKKNFGLGFIDIALWTAGGVLLIFMPRLIKRQRVNIIVLLACITMIPAISNVATYGPVKTPYAIDERSKFEFSKSENIIIFLFDAYQMDLLLDIADSEPSLMAPFDGFTLYDNNVAVFAKTYPTIPLFFTGQRYKKEEPLLDFFDKAYENSLLETLQSKGWDIGLYPNLIHFPALVNAIKVNPSIMDNTIGGVPEDAKIGTYLQTLDLSLFRSAPHVAKPLMFNKGRFRIKKNAPKSLYSSAENSSAVSKPFKYKSKQKHAAVGFRDLLDEHGTTSLDAPALRFYHFMIPHAPNWLDENLASVEHEASFEAYRNYSIAGLKLMGAYLEGLKDIGAYDNTTILFVSDHGMGTRNKRQYNPSTQSYNDIEKFAIARSAAKSILLLKNKGDRGALEYSDKGVSGIDIAPTIAAAAGIKLNGVEGQDINTLSAATPRKRLFNYYEFSTWDSKYLDDFDAFEVDGHVRDEASWKNLGKMTTNIKLKNSGDYKIGELASYGADIKTDTNHLNAFIASNDYIISPNYVNAPKGELELNMTLDKAVDSQSSLLLQFEIYSGATIDRKIIVNGSEKITSIKPKRRVLNQGYIIPPEIHKGQKTFNFAFAAAEGQPIAPLHLSSVKLSVYDPESIETKNSPIPF